MDTLCRVCIEKVAKCTSLSSRMEDSSNLSFFDFLNKCTTLNARESDSLPQSLCSVCANAMKTFYSFMKLAEKSDLILREALRNLIAEGRYNDRREIPCGEIAITKKIEEGPIDFNQGDSFHCQPSKNSTEKQLCMLDIVKEESRASESTSIVDVKNAGINETEKFHSNLDHPEGNIEGLDDILLCVERHLTSIDAKHYDSEDDVPISLLKSRWAKNEDRADSQSNSLSEAFCIPSNVPSKIGRTEAESKEVVKEYPPSVHGAGGLIDNGISSEQATIRNEKVEGDSFHCQPGQYSSGSSLYILDIVKEEPRLSESTSIVAVKDAEIDKGESNINHPESSIEEPDNVLSRRDGRRLAINYTKPIDSEDDVPIDLLKSRLYKNGDETDNVLSRRDFRRPAINYTKLIDSEDGVPIDLLKSILYKHGDETESQSKVHLEIHKGIRHKCNQCDKEFTHINALRRHINWHANPKPFKCENCGKLLCSKNEYTRHMEICKRRRKPQQLNKCDHCDKEFRSIYNLHKHMRCHKNAKSFKCGSCGKLFRRKDLCIKHNVICKRRSKPQQLKTPELRISETDCGICGKTFSTEDHLVVHMKNHLGITTSFKCENCGEFFVWKCTYTKHLGKCKGPRQPKPKPECEICGKQFSKRYHLGIHKEAHKRIKKKCVECGKQISSLGLKRHMIMHTNRKTEPIECEICGKTYSNKGNLNIHMELHMGVTRKCDQCGKVFTHRISFLRHLKWHKNPRPFKCEYCGKAFFKKLSEKHKQICKPQPIHSEPKKQILLPGKKAACEICGKQFRQKRYLSLHMELHNGIIKKCEQCGKEFKSSHALKRHMKRHTNTESYKCEKCGEFFAWKRSYTRHVDICKGPRQPKTKPKCEICGKQFHRNFYLNLHMEVHKGIRHKCDQCGKEFKSRIYLKRHTKLHTYTESYKCEKCFKFFAWKRSLTKHLDKCKGPRQPNECKICGKGFSTRYYLSLHKETHTGNSIHFLNRDMELHTNAKPFKCENCGKSFASKNTYMDSGHKEICKPIGNTIDDTEEPILHSRGNNAILEVT